MKKFFITFLLGLMVGGGGVWYVLEGRKNPSVRSTEQTVQSTAQHAVDVLKAKLDALDLRSDDIKKELTETGKVVRRKAREVGNAVADATADARITGAIKTKLAIDSDLSAWSISVSTTDGRVTLAGTVSSYEHIGKAILLAMETAGVREVVSTLQVK